MLNCHSSRISEFISLVLLLLWKIDIKFENNIEKTYSNVQQHMDTG